MTRIDGTFSHLPEEYTKAFAAFVPKDTSGFVDEAVGPKPLEESFQRWRNGSPANAVTIVGAPGSAAPFVRDQLRLRISRQMKVTAIELDRYAIAHDGLSGALGARLGLERSTGAGDLLKRLVEADRQTIFLDRCHDLFLRRINGFAPLYELQHVMSSTRDKVFWVLLWTPYTWYYLDRTVGLADHFDARLSCGPVRAETLERWIKLKHEATGHALDFGERALERDEGHWLPIDLAPSFAASAGGDFEAAAQVWLRALRPRGDRTVEVTDFPDPEEGKLELAEEEDAYILGSMLFHERISLDELAEDLNLTDTDMRRHLNRLTARGLLHVDPDPPHLCRLDPERRPAVIRVLDRKNLISEKGRHGS